MGEMGEMNEPQKILLWAMKIGPAVTTLGSVYGTGAVIYLGWDERPDQHVNRTHYEDTAEHADEWLLNATSHLARTGSVFVVPPHVVRIRGYVPDRMNLGSWVELNLRDHIEHKLEARV